MKVYLMARYGRRQEMLRVAADLEALGYEVTSRWIRGDHELDDALLNSDPEFREREGARFAKDDLEDLSIADCAIAFTEEPGEQSGMARGGRHFEAGVALCVCGLNDFPMRRLLLVGPRENVFYCLPEWERYTDWLACWAALRAEAESRW